MAYNHASDNFVENMQLIGPAPMADPQNWNLNHGLNELTEAIQSDFNAMRRELRELRQLVDQIQRNVRR